MSGPARSCGPKVRRDCAEAVSIAAFHLRLAADHVEVLFEYQGDLVGRHLGVDLVVNSPLAVVVVGDIHLFIAFRGFSRANVCRDSREPTPPS